MGEATKPEPKVERSIDLDAPASEVWRAITDPELLRDWLAEEVDLDPEAGGELSVRGADGERNGTVERCEEDELLVFTWQGPDAEPSRVELRLIELPDTTRLTVTETRLQAAGPTAQLDWSAKLESLRLCLASLVYA